MPETGLGQQTVEEVYAHAINTINFANPDQDHVTNWSPVDSDTDYNTDPDKPTDWFPIDPDTNSDTDSDQHHTDIPTPTPTNTLPTQTAKTPENMTNCLWGAPGQNGRFKLLRIPKTKCPRKFRKRKTRKVLGLKRVKLSRKFWRKGRECECGA